MDLPNANMAASKEHEKQSVTELRRVKWDFAALTAFVALVPPSQLFSVAWNQLSGSDASKMLACTLTAVASALIIGGDIWALRVRYNPLWKDITYCIVMIGGLAAMIVLRETGLWVWSFLYGDLFFITLGVTLSAIAFLTERVKHVRVYMGARRLQFVYAQTDL